MYKLLIVMIISIYISGCTAFNNPFKKETVTSTSFCKMDLSKRIELERISFKLPKPISGLKPCQAGKVMHDLTRDHKDLFIRLLSFENNIYSSLGSMTMRVQGDLNLLGRKIETPAQWLARHKVMWKGSYRDDRPVRRKIKRIKLKGRECIRIYKTSHVRKYSRGKKSPIKPRLIGYDIEYVCWDADAKNYPPFAITAGVGYEKGKITFPYDMDKDILLPVFNSLKLKKLDKLDENRRIRKFEEKIKASCISLIDSTEDDIKDNRYDQVGIKQIYALNNCNYDTRKLKKWWCDNTIAASKGDIKKSKYRMDTRGFYENLKACQKR